MSRIKKSDRVLGAVVRYSEIVFHQPFWKKGKVFERGS